MVQWFSLLRGESHMQSKVLYRLACHNKCSQFNISNTSFKGLIQQTCEVCVSAARTCRNTIRTHTHVSGCHLTPWPEQLFCRAASGATKRLSEEEMVLMEVVKVMNWWWPRAGRQWGQKGRREQFRTIARGQRPLLWSFVVHCEAVKSTAEDRLELTAFINVWFWIASLSARLSQE